MYTPSSKVLLFFLISLSYYIVQAGKDNMWAVEKNHLDVTSLENYELLY